MDTIDYLKKNLKTREVWLQKELATLRIGRASPALVEDIIVDYCGSKMPVKQLATISAPEPRTLVVQPWDKNAVSAVEKAIQASSLGINPIVDKDVVRVTIPALTEERRSALAKIVRTKLEEAKITARKDRDEAIRSIEVLFAEKKINEDDKFREKQEAQKAIDEANKGLEDAANKKEKEIKEL